MGRLVIHHDHRMHHVLGWLALAFGIALLLMDHWLPGARARNDLAPARWGAGLLFTIAGAGLVMLRSTTTIDPTESRVVRETTVVISLGKKTETYGRLTMVGVARELGRIGRAARAPIFPVRLVGPDTSVTIEVSYRAEAARRRAEQVAEFLSLPVHDAT